MKPKLSDIIARGIAKATPKVRKAVAKRYKAKMHVERIGYTGRLSALTEGWISYALTINLYTR